MLLAHSLNIYKYVYNSVVAKGDANKILHFANIFLTSHNFQIKMIRNVTKCAKMLKRLHTHTQTQVYK